MENVTRSEFLAGFIDEGLRAGHDPIELPFLAADAWATENSGTGE